MSWITPHTNWYSGNYYNLEDAQRIADNICYLLDMARNIYSGNINCLVNRRRKTSSGGIFYGLLENVNVANMTAYDSSEYTRSMTSWLGYDAANFVTLVKLMMLSYQAEPTTKVGRWINYDTSDFYVPYEDPGIFADSVSSGTFNYVDKDPLYALWEPQSSSMSGTSDKIPVYTAWEQAGSSASSTQRWCRVRIWSSTSICSGQPFWNYKVLSAIEQTIANVHTRLIRY